MSDEHEIPSDGVVLTTLENTSLSAAALVEALVAQGYEWDDSRRAVHRCLNRGSITLNQQMKFTVAQAAYA